MKKASFLFVLFLLLNCKNAEEPESPVVISSISLDTLKLKPVDPPKPKVIIPDYDTAQWVELISLDSTIVIDLKYATTDNFVKEQLYDCGRCFLRHEAANQLVKVQKILAGSGYRLKMLDCYRPLPVQQRLWDKFQNASYITPPDQGSMHNRGQAVDLTIVNGSGQDLDMGTDFDFFGKEAHHTFTNLPDTVLANRRLLKNTMKMAGFRSIRTEWWHYSYPAKMYKLSDMVWNCEPKE